MKGTLLILSLLYVCNYEDIGTYLKRFASFHNQNEKSFVFE